MGSIRCPECRTLHESEAIACTQCGLLFLHKDAPVGRRAEDRAQHGRRASDAALVDCPYCRAHIEKQAVRCRHCGQIVDEDYRRDRVKRLRDRVNYASWVLYVFGLVTFMLFRPVGLIAIAAGLLLSIAYYAIAAELLEVRQGESRFRRWMRSVRSQLRFERVTVPVPAFRKAKLVFIGTPVLATIVGYLANFLVLQQPMNEILKANPAFHGMSVSAHYDYWIIPGVVVYDLRRIGPEASQLQVHTAFLEYARRQKDREFDKVLLQFQGRTRYSLDGATFQKAGMEYGRRNFAWVLFDLPRLFEPEGDQPPPGTAEADALLEFHRRWYADEISGAR